jgi:hypothetical protein
MAREMLPMPDHRLAVGHVFIGLDDRIWLSRIDTDGTYSVLDGRTGAEVARATLPAGPYRGLGVETASGEFYWSVERDAYGIPTVVRYRIRINGEGSGSQQVPEVSRR